MNPALILGAAALMLISKNKKTSSATSEGADAPGGGGTVGSKRRQVRAKSTDFTYTWTDATANLAKLAAFAESKNLDSREPSNDNILRLSRAVAKRMYPGSPATKNNSWPKTMKESFTLGSKSPGSIDYQKSMAWKGIWEICVSELKALRPRS